ncbi:MAG: hypothetical protein PHR61_00930 [Candidatus Absconditabacteria bacterium]|nr:hypothetical protein [Candidatus Absconditabacteria bacterium]
MAKKFKNFLEAKTKLLDITQRLQAFWEKDGKWPKKPTLNKLTILLDSFVDVVNIAENLANEKGQKDLVKQIRSFFVPEEELTVLLLMIVAGESVPEEDFPKYGKTFEAIMKRFISVESRNKREEELRNDLKKIEAILLQ